jgi:streptogramin lyase
MMPPDKVAKVTTLGSFTEYNVPSVGGNAQGIAAGPDGNLWFTELDGNKVAKVTPAGAFTEYPLPPPNPYIPSPVGIAAGPDGNLWFTEGNGNKVAKITTVGVVTEYPIPTPASAPSQITAGPDGNLWFTESADKVAKVTTAGVITEYPVPTTMSAPNGIVAGADGSLWFTETTANKVAKATTGGVITEYTVPTAGSGPVGIAAGPDGNLWVTELNANKVARMTISGVFSEYAIPTQMSNPGSIAAGPDGNVWFVEGGARKVAKIVVTPVSSPVAALPAVANAAYGGYTTQIYVQNAGAGPAKVNIKYFDSSGSPVGTGDSINALAVNGLWTVRQDNGKSFAAGQAGSAVIYSDQPVAVFVNEFAPGNASDATSYSAIQLPGGTSRTLYAPAIASNAYGGYTTGIGLVNLATTSADITITYSRADGMLEKTQILNGVGPGAYRGIYSGNSGSPTDASLPAGFAGTATIASTAGPLAAVVNETGPGGQFSSYDAVVAGATSLYAPVTLNGAYGGFNTAIGFQNVGTAQANVTVSYSGQVGSSSTTQTFAEMFPLPAGGYFGDYNGGGAANRVLPDGFHGSATISSSQPLAAIVNEIAAPAAAGAPVTQSTSYNTFAAGTAAAHLPLIENAGLDGLTTSIGIENVGANVATVKIDYYNATTGSLLLERQLMIPPGSFVGVYTPDDLSMPGTRATAVIRADSASLAVIGNEVGPGVFMSYNAQ